MPRDHYVLWYDLAWSKGETFHICHLASLTRPVLPTRALSFLHPFRAAIRGVSHESGTSRAVWRMGRAECSPSSFMLPKLCLIQRELFLAATKIVSANAKKRPLNAYFVTQKEVSLTRRYSSFDVSLMTIKLFAWTKYWILGPERILNELYEVLLYLRSLPKRGAHRKGLRTRPRRCHDANSLR